MNLLAALNASRVGSDALSKAGTGIRPNALGRVVGHRVVSWTQGVLAVAILLCTAAGLHAQAPIEDWFQQSPVNSPSARGNQVMAYDSWRQRVVLFGGGSVADTWLWDGSNWTQANPVNSPPPRGAAAMAFDSSNGQAVMFGGIMPNSATARLGDTWLWNGTNWTQTSVSGGPPARDGHAMVYDPVHGQVVLFGGLDLNGSSLSDTWLWNGTTWTQASPAHSPSARFSHSMAYDAATGQVLLFGGEANGQYVSDTWVWNGLDWTQQTPANSPSARYGAAMDYDAALAQVILFGGYNGNYQNDTWSWSGTAWTQIIPTVPPSVRYFNKDMVYDAARGQMLLYGGFNFDNAPSVFGDTWEFGVPSSFGSVNVCPNGQTTPSPCSKAINFTYHFPNGVTLGTPIILSNGLSGSDFNLTYSGTGACTGTVLPGYCSMNMTFTPTAPGLRTGAIELTDTSGNVISTAPISGVGQAPAVAFSPFTASAVNTGAFTLNTPKGLLADAAGNFFIADTGENGGVPQVLKIAANGTVSTVGTGLRFPQGLAEDGAGNLYIADNNLNEVVEVPAGCATANCQIAIGSNSRSQLGVAVDGAGNVFFDDFLDGEVIKNPPGCASAACQTVVYSGGAGSEPVGIALDSAGDLFVADFGLKQVVEVPVTCPSVSCQVRIGSGWNQPDGVAVDAAGDVYVADAGLQELIEIPAGCTAASCENVLQSGVEAVAVSVNAAGDLYFDDYANQQVLHAVRSQPLALTFQATNVGSTSSDSPKTIALQNVGNQPLNGRFPALFLAGAEFQASSVDTGSNCTRTNTVAPGETCDVSLSFTPDQGGTIETYASFYDNALNSTSATQSFLLTGTGISPSSPLFISLNGGGAGSVTDSTGQINCSEVPGGTPTGNCQANFAIGTRVVLTEIAQGTSLFTGWGGVCRSAGTSPTCVVDYEQISLASATFVNQNAGSYSVCTAGQASVGTCSGALSITFNLPVTTTIGAIRVVTQGTTGLDFSQATSGTTCTGTISAGNACTVGVNFAPLAPGLRSGAVQLFDNAGTLLQTVPVYGVGLEPEAAFDPGVQTNVAANLPSRLQSVTVDAAGDLFIAGVFGAIKQTPSGAQTALSVTGTGAEGFYDIAVDGAGNIYLADPDSNRVVELTPAGVQTTVPATGLSFPNGVKVDGLGNVFITDRDNNRVVKVSPDGLQTTVPTTGLVRPYFPAIDATGDIFFLDNGSQRVLKVTPDGVQSTVPFTGLTALNGLAVDAAGDVFVSDQILNKVFEMTSAGVQITLATSGLNVPAGLAVDTAGDVFVAVNAQQRVVKVTRSQPPSFTFATTNVGSTSVDSPQTVSLQNVGTQPLTGSLVLNMGGNFTQNLPADCSTFSLLPGSSCQESFSFTPQSATFASGTGVLTDNSLNAGSATQTITLSGTGAASGVAGTVAVPGVIGQTQTAAAAPITSSGLTVGSVNTASSDVVPAGAIISQNPVAGTQVVVGSAVNLLVSSGVAQPAVPNPLLLENNYFVTGDYVSAGVTLRGLGVSGTATGGITIQGVPAGADVVDAFLYWETVENTSSASSPNGIFNGYTITGQQIGNDIPNYVDGALTGTLRAYRANVNVYLPVGANGVRAASGTYTVSLPDGGGNALPMTEGASLVFVYRVLSSNFPLKSVVIYDGAVLPVNSTAQVVKGFYDAVGGANGTGKNTTLSSSNGSWNNSISNVTLGQPDQYSAPLGANGAYAAVILSTPVNNSDNDGILDAWKAGAPAGTFHAGQPGYYDAKTATWVGLPGAKHGQKDLFVQMDYMCGAVLSDGSCDPAKENLFPSPDANGNDPLAMVQKAFAASGVQLHLQVGNAIPEDTCTDDLTTNPATLCQFPGQPGVIGWKNSLEFSKLYPRNLLSCLQGGDCTTRFPYGQKDSYHYVLFGHSLAVPAYNTRFGTLTSINVVNGVTTIVTADRGNGISACPGRITLSGVLGNPSLNGVYNTTSCADTKTITVATPGVPNWNYPNSALPEPVIGLTSGTITSISGYSDLGGADSAVTLGLWLTAPNQDMSKKANVVAGTLFHEIGHTLGLSHGGLYYDTPDSYVPTFEANCKPNYQSIMNYLFQLDGVGPSGSIAFSNQTLNTLNENTIGSVKQLTDTSGNAASFPTSAWYVPYTTGSIATPATRHCDGTPLAGDQAYRVDASISPVTPAWSNGQDINFIGVPQSKERGYNDLAAMDLRQVGATGGQFASLATLLSFGSSAAPLNIAAGGNVTLGSGGSIALGSGGSVTLGSGGNVTLGSGGTIALGSGGNVTLGSGGNVTLGSGGTITLGSGGNVTLGSGGNVTLGSGGTITLGGGGNVTLGSGGNVTLGSGGTITLGSGGTVTIPASGGSYTIDSSGGTIALGSGGNVTLGSGGNVTLGSGGTIALGSGGNVTLGSGGNVTLGSGGTIALGSGGNVTLGSGGNVTLGSGGTITLGSGGNVTLGSGGNVTLGSGGTVTLGSGGNVALGSGGNVTLGSGGQATLGAGGTVTLGSGGNVTLGSGGNVTLGSGGTITLGSGGNVTLGSGGNVTLGSGGTITLGSGGNVTLGSGGTVTLGSGGTITLGSGGAPIVIGAGGTYTFGSSGGTITLGSGGNVTLGSGGNVTLGSGGTIALGSGGNITLGSGGNVTLGSGGNITLGSGGTITLGSGGNITLGSGGVVTLGNGGSVNLGSGSSSIPLATVPVTTPSSAGPSASGSNELTYETANSVVRAPVAPVKTITPAGVRITWTAPAFGVVQTYTIYRSSNGAPPIVIGSVSGVNGNPPATEFTDTNPDLTSQTVVYTVTTTLVPDTTGGTSRNSPQSAPAVLKNDQTILLGPLPSSVVVTNPVTITATAMSGGIPNGLQVSFSVAGSCLVSGQSIANNVSSAMITPTNAGSCTITAAQIGTTAFNAANSVSGTFMVLAQDSTLKPQTINFPVLQNMQYGGGTFTVSATSSAGLPVTFTAAGPCTAAGGISGAGVCTITASAAGNTIFSAASLTQSFTIFPAVLKVTASNLSASYGQPLPALTYTYSGFVNNDSPAVIFGAPLLATTATPASAPGKYPITVATGTLAAANYSFLYVGGTLSVQLANQSPLTVVAASPLMYGQSETLSVLGGSTGGAVTYTLTGGPCSLTGAKIAATSGSGTCQVTATMAGNSIYNPVTSNVDPIPLSLAGQVITLTPKIPINAGYGTTFYVNGTATSGGAILFSSAGGCTVTTTGNIAAYKMTAATGTCSVIANQPGNGNYAAAPTVRGTVNALKGTPAVSFTGAPANAAYKSTFTLTAATNASTPAMIRSSGACTNSGTTVTMTSGTGTCSLSATWAPDANYNGLTLTQFTQATPLPQIITFTTSPPASALFNTTFKVAATGGASLNPVTFTSAGACSNAGSSYTITNSLGTCSVIVNQAGNPNYSAAAPLIQTVQAAGPVISLSRSSIDFGSVYLGGVNTQALTLKNTGTAPATISDPVLSVIQGGNSKEFIALNLCPKPLAAGRSCSINIAFIAGPFYTPQTATLQIMSDAPGSPQPVALTALAINPVASLSTTSVNFGTVKQSSKTTRSVTLSNTGATPLNLISLQITGTNISSFTQTNSCGSMISPGANCVVSVTFSPASAGSSSGTLTVKDNAQAGGGTQSVALIGIGN